MHKYSPTRGGNIRVLRTGFSQGLTVRRDAKAEELDWIEQELTRLRSLTSQGLVQRDDFHHSLEPDAKIGLEAVLPG